MAMPRATHASTRSSATWLCDHRSPCRQRCYMGRMMACRAHIAPRETWRSSPRELFGKLSPVQVTSCHASSRVRSWTRCFPCSHTGDDRGSEGYAVKVLSCAHARFYKVHTTEG